MSDIRDFEQLQLEHHVGHREGKIWVGLLIVTFTTTVFAQKVKVGYDKSVDFSRYKSYTWAELARPSARPLLKEIVIGLVDRELKSRGLARAEGNGDLILVGEGGVDYGINAPTGTPILPTYGGPPLTQDATMWTGATGPSILTASYVPEGMLVLEFVDRNSNKAIWAGTVKQKLDVEQKTKSLDLIEKAIGKLLKQFPPKSAASK